MCFGELDATIFVEQPNEVEYRDNLFHVTIRFGKTVVRRVYNPTTFMASLLAAEQAFAAFQAEQTGQATNVATLYPVVRLSA